MGENQFLSFWERQIAWLMEHYALELSEALTLESAQDFIYISDPKTYDMYYMSLLDPTQLHDSWKNYKGKKCYEVLQERTDPCPFCTNHLLSKDRYYVWEHYNPLIGGNYVLKDKLIDWHGKTARLEVVMDVTERRRVDKVLKDSLETQNILTSCIETLVYTADFQEAQQKILSVLVSFFGASFGYIHYFSADGPDCTALWDPAGSYGETVIGRPSAAALELWRTKLPVGQQIVLKTIDDLREKNPTMYAFLEKKGITSVCITPIYIEDRLAGLLFLDGITERWGELSVLKILTSYLSSQFQKIELAEENQRILYKDALTGYHNFEGFRMEVSKILESKQNRKYALWYSDLKNFKYVNDVFGYDVGNRILKYWADSMAESLREGETFARVSADNFISLRWYRDTEELEARFRQTAERLACFEETASKKFRLELVCGIYLLAAGERPLSLEEMMNRANMAQKSVKPIPGSHMAIYSEAMRQKIISDLEMEAEMRDAMRHNEFILYLQPQVQIGESEGPLRAEALVRWQRKNNALILPGAFIDLFEKNGMIVDLDLYVFEKACAYLQERQKRGLPPLCLAVNVSRISMLQPNFVAEYCRIKRQYALADGTVELEFTESIAVENYEQFRKVILQLKENGFLCAMDDFGTGQSSLNVLQSLPIDVLKLDRMFFQTEEATKRGEIVVNCVLQMAKQLEMKTVAEGIESMELVEKLRKQGCDYIQGYIYSKPIPVETFEKMMAEGQFSPHR